LKLFGNRQDAAKWVLLNDQVEQASYKGLKNGY